MSFQNRKGRKVSGLLGALSLACMLASPLQQALADPQPVELAAPYEYLGWGSPQPPAGVLAAAASKT